MIRLAYTDCSKSSEWKQKHSMEEQTSDLSVKVADVWVYVKSSGEWIISSFFLSFFLFEIPLLPSEGKHGAALIHLMLLLCPLPPSGPWRLFDPISQFSPFFFATIVFKVGPNLTISVWWDHFLSNLVLYQAGSVKIGEYGTCILFSWFSLKLWL